MNLVRRELAPDAVDEANTLVALEDDKLLEMLRQATGKSAAS